MLSMSRPSSAHSAIPSLSADICEIPRKGAHEKPFETYTRDNGGEIVGAPPPSDLSPNFHPVESRIRSSFDGTPESQPRIR
jgi:hypothetical protein